jgi:hypothetical protein
MIPAAVTFGVSLFGILLLFVMKKVEVSRGALIGGSARDSADLFALRVKWVFLVIEWYLSRLPDFLFLLSRHAVRAGALYLARTARYAESQAYHLADFVSHKRNFERRETKSNYLKQVGEPTRARTDDSGPVATE